MERTPKLCIAVWGIAALRRAFRHGLDVGDALECSHSAPSRVGALQAWLPRGVVPDAALNRTRRQLFLIGDPGAGALPSSSTRQAPRALEPASWPRGNP